MGSLVKKSPVSVSVIKRLILKYIDNWATCDSISSEIAKKLINSPESVVNLINWARSQNSFLRRVAVVTIIKLKGKIKDWENIIFQIFSFLNNEKHFIVRKALIWLKKVS